MKKKKLPKYQIGTSSNTQKLSFDEWYVQVYGVPYSGDINDPNNTEYNMLLGQYQSYLNKTPNAASKNNFFNRLGNLVKPQDNVNGITRQPAPVAGSPEAQGYTLDPDGKYRKAEYSTPTTTITTPSGKQKEIPTTLQLSPEFQALNSVLDMLSFFGGAINNERNNKYERERLIKAAYPQSQYNMNEAGINNIPVYLEKGGSVSVEKAKEILRDGTIHGKKLTAKQKRYFGWIAGGSKPKMKNGGSIHINPAHKGDFTAKAKQHGMSVQAFAKHVLANKDDFSTETIRQANFARNAKKFKHKMQEGGDVQEVYGVNPEFADANLEQGEIFQTEDGEIQKVAETEPTHEEGGSNQPNVERVLEDTSDKRKDKNSKLLRVSPTVAKEIVGFKPKSTVSHSKLFELAKEYYENQLERFQKQVKNNLQYVENGGGIYAQNSLEENLKLINDFPTEADIFDAIYDHQETVKDENNMHNTKNKYAIGGDPREKALKDQYKYLKDRGYTGPMNLQQMQDFAKALGNEDTLIASTRNTSSPEPVANPLMQGVPAATTPTLPTNIQKPFDETAIRNMGVSGSPTNTVRSDYDLNSSVKPSTFYEPLRWYDIASPVLSLISSLDREPVALEQLTRNPLQARLLNPQPALQQNQSDYNAAITQLPSSGVGYANLANLQAQRYAAANQVIGQYANQNAQIQNQTDQYNDQQQFALQQQNLALRDQFTNRVLQSKEAQRQSKLRALDTLFTRVAQNRRFNRDANLLMQMYPYFDQYGQFNGNDFRIIQTAPGQGAVVEKATGRVITDKVELDANGNIKKQVNTTKTTVK